MMNSYVLRPRSRGAVRLASADPRDAPLIDPNYLAERFDLDMSIAGVRLMRDIMRRPAFAPYVKREHMPGGSAETDAELAEFVRRFGRSAYHPSGACKMGVDEAAVVAPDLRVHGIAGLRVCDSSIMPSLVSSNTNIPTIMIAEHASDLIRERARIPSMAAVLDTATAAMLAADEVAEPVNASSMVSGGTPASLAMRMPSRQLRTA